MAGDSIQVYQLMVIEVKIWTMEADFGILTFYSKVKLLEDKMYALFRVHLEEKAALERVFEFWNHKEHNGIWQ